MAAFPIDAAQVLGFMLIVYLREDSSESPHFLHCRSRRKSRFSSSCRLWPQLGPLSTSLHENTRMSSGATRGSGGAFHGGLVARSFASGSRDPFVSHTRTPSLRLAREATGREATPPCTRLAIWSRQRHTHTHTHTLQRGHGAANGATSFRTQTYTHEFKPHRTLSKLSVTHTPHTNTDAVIHRRPPVRLSKKEGRKSHIGCGSGAPSA